MTPRLCIHCGKPYEPARNNAQKQRFCSNCKRHSVAACHKRQRHKFNRLADPIRKALKPFELADAEAVGKVLGLTGQTIRNIERNALCKIAAAIQLYSKT